MVILVYILMAASIILITWQFLPVFIELMRRILRKRVESSHRKLHRMFIRVGQEKLFLYYLLATLGTGFLGYALFKNIVLAVITGLAGFILPSLFIRAIEARRQARFQSQIVDALSILSSSLKAGLSLLQAIEVLTEEMPAPISEEFGLIVRENKMGITLEESFKRLNQRLELRDLDMMINAILVARETGGDLTKVFQRLSVTIRDNRKLTESIKTLTLQGRMQGYIMSALPFLFLAWVLNYDKHHFDILLTSETGRILLITAVCLQAVGMFLIMKFSKIRI